jgi:hypothetical protein
MSNGRSRIVAAALACVYLAGCSDVYYDRRDTVTFRAGDANASNRVTHAVDMWPAAAGYRDMETNGQKMQGAVERYRTNKVTPPVGLSTSTVAPGASPAAGGAAAGPATAP